MPTMNMMVGDPQSSSLMGETSGFDTQGADEDIRIAEEHFNIDISQAILIQKVNCVYISGNMPVVGTLYLFNEALCFFS